MCVTPQKTWRDLLGDDVGRCQLSYNGKCIVKRSFGEGCFKVLWTFEMREQAEVAFQRWVFECNEAAGSPTS